ncbi:amino acid/polyamine/organocation transporter (APC superfamily) [Streptomyces puniciscabiei]|uniref:Amino acid/polyamine/organocation transporter (APC superfamily) n=1 Tax=Streptomyces puniciscabiei TaxID=164348 RepID=A0A542UA61_9ACTN|nr:APC family permease [Streptomyces puniciscabiei]TQK95966.1 amino acid/polyamine/organocation transporter (APC superfamily) [Streptomyces puniciscabiei]
MRTIPRDNAEPGTTAKGLRHGSVGLLASMALGLSSVAPAYSIAVTLGFVVLAVGDLAPAALLLGFVPILLTAFAFRELNRDMPDCGTTFVWVTRAFGPFAGWLAGGWVVQIATLIAMAALSRVGAANLLAFLGLDTLAGRPLAVTCTAMLVIALVAALAYRGVQLAAGAQYVMLALQLVSLLGFAAVALARDDAATPSLAWLNPFGFPDAGAMAEGVILCLFIYWGWDALLSVNEETTDSTRVPGRAAVLSTLVLLGTYLFTAYGALAYAGPGSHGLGDADTAADVLAALAPPVLGDALARIVQLAVCVSAIAALLSCLVSSPRGTLSMAAHGALPEALTRIHPRFRTPAFATVCWAAATAGVLAALTALSTDFLGDALLPLGLLIAFYYAVTGLACVWHFRADLRTSPRDLLLKGILPGTGAVIMLAAFARCAYDMLDPAYGSTSVAGIGGVLLLGVGSIALGALVALAVRPRFRRFFRDGRTTVTQLTVTED